MIDRTGWPTLVPVSLDTRYRAGRDVAYAARAAGWGYRVVGRYVADLPIRVHVQNFSPGVDFNQKISNDDSLTGFLTEADQGARPVIPSF